MGPKSPVRSGHRPQEAFDAPGGQLRERVLVDDSAVREEQVDLVTALAEAEREPGILGEHQVSAGGNDVARRDSALVLVVAQLPAGEVDIGLPGIGEFHPVGSILRVIRLDLVDHHRRDLNRFSRRSRRNGDGKREPKDHGQGGGKASAHDEYSCESVQGMVRRTR